MTNMPPAELQMATVGVITALKEEFAAVRAALGCEREVAGGGVGTGSVYALTRVPSNTGGYNVVAAALMPDMGNNVASIVTSHLLRDCPNAQRIIMSGIAGAVPYPEKPADHVR